MKSKKPKKTSRIKPKGTPQRSRNRSDRSDQKRAPQRQHKSLIDPDFLNEQSGHWLYGRHTVAAALLNPNRKFHQLLCTQSAVKWLLDKGCEAAVIEVKVLEVTSSDLDALLPLGSVHQGVAARVEPLVSPALDTILSDHQTAQPLIVLDQITDPQNIGTIFRNAAAFNVAAIIAQDRRIPTLAGALAKAAVGTIEQVPCVQVVNIARTLHELQDAGYHCVGLAGEASTPLPNIASHEKIALVLGTEGSGLRPLVAKTCDSLAYIPINSKVESLNVSTASAIALYELAKHKM